MTKTQSNIKIIECPRDAMQGIHDFIPTQAKINYIKALLNVGFDTLDFGSFVSPKAIPQLRDTAEVYESIKDFKGSTKLLSIVANTRGAVDACKHDLIDFLGYPFSLSETFQRRNTNASIETSLDRIKEIKKLADDYDKKVVVYLSMGFGNPYGDDWNVDIVKIWTNRLADLGFDILMLSDTIGVSNPANISYLFSELIPAFPDIEIGAHLHTAKHNWKEKVESAFESGCRRFDGAINGYGGCPMAQDNLIGNMPTEHLLYFFESTNLPLNINYQAFTESVLLAGEIFQ
jgi:hydroxymethylglutaryl-CoA lyase